jgi:hypothetical protein
MIQDNIKRNERGHNNKGIEILKLTIKLTQQRAKSRE